MTLTLSPSPLPAILSTDGPLPSWKSWIVPTTMLRDFIYDHKHIWQFRYSPPQLDTYFDLASQTSVPEGSGWRTYLSQEIVEITGQTIAAAQRTIYRVLAKEMPCINAVFAEAVTLSVDVYLDHDTEIPVLPGNMHYARELLDVRDGRFRRRRTKEQQALQREVMELTIAILNQPDRLAEFQDAAPFDCLRSPWVQ